MIANIIGAVIIVFVGFTLFPQIQQEMDNIANCNQTTIPQNNSLSPIGSTGSFGGAGGDYHFGGYDGQVTHKSFMSQYALVKTDKSVINPDCEPFTGFQKQLIQFVPIVFVLGILLAGVSMAYHSLRDVGMV